MKRYLPLFIFYFIATSIFWQWSSSHQPQPKTQAPASVQVNLPAPLQALPDPAVKTAFQTVMEKVSAGDKSPKGDGQKRYNEAVAELQKVANEKTPGGLAATLEIANIQWHKLDQKDAAAATLNKIKLQPVPADLQVPVQIGTNWESRPVKDTAERQYDQLVTAINQQNRSNFGYQFIQFFVQMCSFAGSYRGAVALILLGVIISVLLTPVRNWQLRTMSKTSKEFGKLQPEIKRIQQQYKGQPEEVLKRTNALYAEHGVNPAAGCTSMLPMFVQMPFMFWLYYAVRMYQYHFTGSFLWIGSSFAVSHTGWTTPKGPVFATSLAYMDIPLLLVYTGSMYLYSKFTPVMTPDPAQQAQSQRTSAIMSLIMPVFLYMYDLPSAFTLYWLAMNVAQILITIFYLRHHPDLKELFKPAKAGAAAAPAAGMAKSAPSTGNGKNARTGASDAATNPPAGDPQAPGARPVQSDLNGGARLASTPRRIEPRNRRKTKKRF